MDSLEAEEQLDRLCDDWESVWRKRVECGNDAVPAPRVEEYLARASALLLGADVSDQEFLTELLAVELEVRESAGETPTRGEYLRRLDGHRDAVYIAFGLRDRDRRDRFLAIFRGRNPPD